MTPGPNRRCRIGRCISGPSLLPVAVKARSSVRRGATRISGVSSMCHGTATPPAPPISGTSSAAFNSAARPWMPLPADAGPK